MKIKGESLDFEAELAEKRPVLFAFMNGIVRDANLAEELTQEIMLRAYGSD